MESFDIGSGERVDIRQPSASSVLLNRIGDSKPSQIYGSLTANGTVILANPNGMVFGPGSHVDVGGLIATTARIDTQAFQQQGRLVTVPGAAGARIVNHGSLRTQGLAALVAPEVGNDGSIVASAGKVQLSAGDTVAFDLYGDGLLSVAASPQEAKAIVRQDGHVSGGQVVLSAAQASSLIDSSVNMEGMVEATALSGSGGTVTLTGDHLALGGHAAIHADGARGGGQVHIGGGYQGGGTLPWAKTVSVARDAVITANAAGKGAGGQVVLWSRDKTSFDGRIEARGGVKGGNGGMIETSSKHELAIGSAATADASSLKGSGGDWLLDPGNITIVHAASAASDANNSITAGVDTPVGGTDATISDFTINQTLNAGTNVTLQTSGTDTNITNTGSPVINYTGAATRTLTLKATGSIQLNNTTVQASGSGGLNTYLWSDADNNNAGAIYSTGSIFSIKNGIFKAAGGLDDGANGGAAGDGKPDNYAWGTGFLANGVLLDNTSVNSTNSTVIYGRGRNDTVSNYEHGVTIGNGSTITNTSGQISIAGISGPGIGFDYGIYMNGAGTRIQTDSGVVNLSGTASTGASGNYNIGVALQNGAAIVSNGTVTTAGAITISGNGGAGSDQANGVYMDGSSISAKYGAIAITGNSNFATGSLNDGVLISSASTISSIGTGASAATIAITGSKSTLSGGGNNGIYMGGGNSTIQTIDGNITLNGTGNGYGFNPGIWMQYDNKILSTGSANIDITGNSSPFYDFTAFGGTNIIGGSSDSGNIVFHTNLIDLESGTVVSTKNNISVLTRTAGTAINLGTGATDSGLQLDNNELGTLTADVDGDSTGRLIIGNATSGAATVNAWSLAGKREDVEVHGSSVSIPGAIDWNNDNTVLFQAHGGDVSLTNTLTKSGSGDSTVTLKATNNVVVTGSNVSASGGKLHTILWADSDANSAGRIAFTGNSVATTNGGDFVAGGGLDGNADGRPDGAAWGIGASSSGVYLGNSSITTGIGAILLNGHGANSTSYAHGVSTYYTTLSGGQIHLTGHGGDGTLYNNGIDINDHTAITSATGGMTFDGTGGTGSQEENRGMTLTGLVSISSTGTGASASDIALNGTGGAGTHDNDGFYLGNGLTISTVDGDISVNGTGGSDSVYVAQGISSGGSHFVSSGTGASAGKITLNGMGGTGNCCHAGVNLDGATQITSAYGDITLSGTGTGYAGVGVTLQNGSRILSTGVDSSGTPAAKITITGTAGSSGDSVNGVAIQGTSYLVSSVDGDISITGNGGTGANASRDGILLSGGAKITSTGATSGAAKIGITGTAAAGTNNNSGIELTDAGTQITSGYGDITLNGTGNGSGNGNDGVDIHNAAQLISSGSGAGAAKINVTGTSNGSGSANFGIEINGASSKISSTGGNIVLTGTGSGSSDATGIEIRYNGTLGTTDGNIALTGYSGVGSADYSRGVHFSSSDPFTIAGNGSLSITGYGRSNGLDSAAVRFQSAGNILLNGSGALNVTADGVYASIAADGTTIFGGPAATGNITLKADKINFIDGAWQTQNNVTVKPVTPGQSIGVNGGAGGLNLDAITLSNLAPDVDGNGVGSLIIGDEAAGTGAMTVAGWNLSGKTYDVELHGGSITQTGGIAWNQGNDILLDSRVSDLNPAFALTNTSVLDSSLTLKSAGSVIINGNKIVNGTGKLNTVLWADSDNNGAGGSVEIVNSTIATNGGNFLAAGGLDDGGTSDGIAGGTVGDGRPDGYAQGTTSSINGLVVDNSSSITSGSGNITLYGRGGDVASLGPIGIALNPGTLFDTTSGAITLIGNGGSTVSGTATFGIAANSGVTIRSTGTGAGLGAIRLTGTGGTAGGTNAGGAGIGFGAQINTVNADVFVTGNGGTGNGYGAISGINFYGGGGINSTGTGANAGNISVAGTGGNSLCCNRGMISFGNALFTTVDGDILFDGHGGGPAGSGGNYGLYLAGGIQITSTGTGASAGTVTVNGTGGLGNDDPGIKMTDAGTLISSAVGAINVNGTAHGTGATDYGIELAADADITSTGSAPITLTAIGGTSAPDLITSGATIDIGGTAMTGNITVNANSVSLANARVRTQNDIVLKPRTAGQAINLAGAAPVAGQLNVSSSTLGLFTADADHDGTGKLFIGDATSGDIAVQGWNMGALGYGVQLQGRDITVDNSAGNYNVTGSYIGRNGLLKAGSGAVNAATSFNALDVRSASADLQAGYIGAPGAATQAMADLITVFGTAGPGTPTYRFAGFNIGFSSYVPPSGGSPSPSPVAPSAPVATPPVPPVSTGPLPTAPIAVTPPIVLPAVSATPSPRANFDRQILTITDNVAANQSLKPLVEQQAINAGDDGLTLVYNSVPVRKSAAGDTLEKMASPASGSAPPAPSDPDALYTIAPAIALWDSGFAPPP